MLIARATEQIHTSMGSMLIGVIVSAVLFGVSLVQTFYYYITYPKDSWYLRTLVAVTAVLDAVHLALISHMIYYYLVSNYNNPEAMQFLVWSVLIEVLFGGMTATLVQCFYLMRVWLLSNKNKFLTGFISIIIMGNAAVSITWVVLAMQLDTFVELLSISSVSVAINVMSTSADIVITASLCIILHRARTGFKKSDTLINRLMLFVVNTGALTSIFATATLISLVASPLTLIYAMFYFCIGRLYTNSFLATLNARKAITGHIDDVSHMLVSIPPKLSNTPQSSSTGSRSQPQAISIRIETTREQHGVVSSGSSRTRSQSKLIDKDLYDEDLKENEPPLRTNTRGSLESDQYPV